MKTEVRISGMISSMFEKYEKRGKKFYTTFLSIKRTSGVYDSIIICIPEEKYKRTMIIGTYLEVHGKLRTQTTKSSVLKTKLYVMAEEVVEISKEQNINEVYIDGIVHTKRKSWTTQRGCIVGLLNIKVTNNSHSSYIPSYVFYDNAKYSDNELKTGDNVLCIGRIQSRIYDKKIENVSLEIETYEVAVSSITKVEGDKDGN